LYDNNKFKCLTWAENDMLKYKNLGPPSKSQTGDLLLAMLLAGPEFHAGAFVTGSYQLNSAQAKRMH
jgi:hypothetical protein